MLRRAWIDCRRHLLALPFFLVATSQAAAQPAELPLATGLYLPQERDYVFPSAEQAQARVPVTVPPQRALGCFECGRDQVSYLAFDGTLHTLTRYAGRYVALLVPETFQGGDGFTEEELRVLLDRSDLVYQHYRELIGGEPVGDGLLPIAFVPSTCGWGCGFVGFKGVEVLDYDETDAQFGRAAALDMLHGVITHEIGHNFDLYFGYWSYLPDHAHAWSNFMDLYITLYSRAGSTIDGPEDNVRNWIEKAWKPYALAPGESWGDCIRDGDCRARGISPERVWGGLTNVLAVGQGPEGVKRMFSFLEEYAGQHPPPFGAEAREDLHIEALAAGAGVNLGCHVDAWRWHASAELRQRMTTQYGGPPLECSDGDADGYSRVLSDCDDGDGAVHPSAAEGANGKDDDCNRIVDDVEVREPQRTDLPEPSSVPFPAVVRGRLTASDLDTLLFYVAAPQRVRFVLCSEADFAGWIFVHSPRGDVHLFQYTFPGECSEETYRLDEAGQWRMEVALNVASSRGRYLVRLYPLPQWPLPPWGTVQEPVVSESAIDMTVVTEELGSAAAAPTAVRFWVSGHGFVGSVPYEGTVSFHWVPPEPLAGGSYGIRAQLLAGETPVSDLTRPRMFHSELIFRNGFENAPGNGSYVKARVGRSLP